MCLCVKLRECVHSKKACIIIFFFSACELFSKVNTKMFSQKSLVYNLVLEYNMGRSLVSRDTMVLKKCSSGLNSF